MKNHTFKLVFISPNNIQPDNLFSFLKFLFEQNYPFIIISENKDNHFIEKCYASGCTHFLSPSASPILLEKLVGEGGLTFFLAGKIKTLDKDFWWQIENLENSDIGLRPLLITGPTGVGKTKIARLIHEYLFGIGKPFIEVNCAEISESLIQSELFGYKKGAFTGAQTNKPGLISCANGGTLFLDEIATMPLAVQAKVLKTLEEKSYLPVGSERREFSDFFLISATCEKINELMNWGKFRQDLFYRIAAQEIYLKGLYQRPEDIPLLLDYFTQNHPRRIIFTNEALETLLSYEWPGNIRELLNLVESLRMVKGGIITRGHLDKKFHNKKTFKLFQNTKIFEYVRENGLTPLIQNLEGEVLNYFFQNNGRKVRKTTMDLKISSNTFYRIKKRISV